MLSYWIWLAIYVFLPLLVLLIWKRDIILQYKKTVLIGGVGSLVFAVPWDHFAIKKGIWSFPQEEILGLWFFGVPLEEWFFIFFVGMELTTMALVFMGERNV